MYSEKVMDHFMNPRNVGEIENADAIGEVGNAVCGDIMRMYLDIDEKLCLCKAGFAKVVSKFDERGNMTEQAFFNTDGNPMATGNGVPFISYCIIIPP